MKTKFEVGDQIIYSPAGDATGRHPWSVTALGNGWCHMERRIHGHKRTRKIEIGLLKNYTRYVPRTTKTK